jgi:hypothetical protein
MTIHRTLLLCLGGFAAGAVVATAAAPDRGELADGLASFVERIAHAEETIRSSPSFGSDAERAGGYLHLTRSIIKSLEAEVLQDPDYPFFRILDFWLREGGDNPDQRYAFSPVRGGETYRIWGRLGSARRVEFQLYAGQPWAGTGRSVGYLAFEDFAVAEDGSFTVHLTPERRETNWLPNPDDATTVFVRHIYDDWSAASTGEVHIDRVGLEGGRKPLPGSSEVARRLHAAAEMLDKSATRWPAFVNQRYAAPQAANRMSPLRDTYALGGAKGRWMAGGHFALSPGKALLIQSWPTSADYQAIQLTDMWFASLEHANQVSSLNTRQAVTAPDGAYYSVISPEDPGVHNWLDTGGLERGVFLLRYDGVQGTIPESKHPSARLVDLAELPKLIPGFERVGEQERERVRRERRRHLQIRSHR